MENIVDRDALIKNILMNNPMITEELGEKLHAKIKGVAIQEYTDVSNQVTVEDCIDYIAIINKTYHGSFMEKSIIEDNFITLFPQTRFEESDPAFDYAGDIDYLGWVGTQAFGIQIKSVTANANSIDYLPSERMKASLNEFEEKYKSKVFIVFSAKVGEKREIQNKEVIPQIEAEIQRLLKDQS